MSLLEELNAGRSIEVPEAPGEQVFRARPWDIEAQSG